MTCVITRRRFNTETETHREKTVWGLRRRTPCEDEGKDWKTASTSYRTSKKPSKHQKVGERRGTGFRRDQPCPLTELRRPASELWHNTFPLLNPLSSGCFDVGALGDRSGAHCVSGVVLSTLHLWIHFNFHSNFMRKRWWLLMFYQRKN